MKKVLIFLFSILSLSAIAQPGSLSQSVIRLRVNDSTAAISANVSQIALGYAPMFWNNQASTPHWDIWNGSSYSHVFDFAGGSDLTASNGLTRVGSDLQAGGPFTSIVWEGNGSPWGVIDSDPTNPYEVSGAPTGGVIMSYRSHQILITPSDQIQLNRSGGGSITVGTSSTFDSGSGSLSLVGNSINLSSGGGSILLSGTTLPTTASGANRLWRPSGLNFLMAGNNTQSSVLPVIYGGTGGAIGIGPIGIANKTTTYTATSTDYFINCPSGSFTVTLPTAVGITGKSFIIKNSGSGTTITIATTSSQTIDGTSPGTLSDMGVLKVVSDGANWLTF